MTDIKGKATLTITSKQRALRSLRERERERKGHKAPGPKPGTKPVRPKRSDPHIETILEAMEMFGDKISCEVLAANGIGSPYTLENQKREEQERAEAEERCERGEPAFSFPDFDFDALKPKPFPGKLKSRKRTIERVRNRMIDDGKLQDTKRPWSRDKGE